MRKTTTKKNTLSLLLLVLSITISAQDVVFNEIASSNSQFLDEDNETPDWIELYNKSAASINLEGWYLSDVEDSIAKWEFPAVNIDPGQSLMLFASGKDRKTIVRYETIINWGDTWHYAIGSETIPSDWNTSTFDTSAWESGPSGFGYGDDDDATLIPENTLSVFVRKNITIADINNISSIIMHVDYDDGFIAYINGHEVARANLGEAGTEVTWDQPATTYTDPNIAQGLPPTAFNISSYKEHLVEGENIIAIQVHNSSSSSSDLSLIPFLSLGYNGNHVITNAPPEIINLKDGNLHTNFKISADGEKLFLSRPDLSIENIMDSIALETNISYGLKPDGTGSYYYFLDPTPGALNTTQGFTGKAENDINYSVPAGVYDASISIAITSASGATIYYTIDGTDPDNQSLLYDGEINISKSTAIKAVAMADDLLPSNPSVASFIIRTEGADLPVVSITTDPYNLFDHNYGLFEMGDNPGNYPYQGANFWQDWERPVYFEYFDVEGKIQVSANAGAKIFGGWSRANEQKSMAIFARKDLGTKSFDYQFFEEKNIDKFKSLVLRNSGNDWASTAFRDGMQTSLTNGLNIDKQAIQPTVVYINGEYWGILNLREKVNEDYLEGNHSGVDSKKVDILEGEAIVNEGSNTHFLDMINYMETHDMSNDSYYEEITRMMDIDNFIEYQITQIYIDNQDWPGNNIKYWRPQTSNGKWRWVLYDTDFGFGIWDDDAYKSNTLDFATEPNGSGWPNPKWSTLVLRKLLENESFKIAFINRYADRINREFLPATVSNTITTFKNNIEDEIPFHHDKWNHLWNWEDKVDELKKYGNNRPTYARTHIKNKFSLSGTYKLSLENADPSQGHIQVNALTINDKTWTGTYFKDIPIRISAIAKPGYKFKHWLGSDEKSATIHTDFSGTTSIEAVFELANAAYESLVINEINYKSSEAYDAGDWIELFNTTGANIDLSGWKLRDLDPSDTFIFPNGTKIEPNGFLVICKDIEKFDEIHQNIPNRIGNFAFGLSSTSDFVLLYDNNNTKIDSVFYESNDPWPNGPNGDGTTLSLLNPLADNTPYSNWDESAKANGTPGKENDIFNAIDDDAVALNSNNITLSAYPNPFKEETTISFSVAHQSFVSIQIIDFKGAVISTLQEDSFSAGEHRLKWNGLSAEGYEIPSGLYFAKITVNHNIQKVNKLMLNR